MRPRLISTIATLALVVTWVAPAWAGSVDDQLQQQVEERAMELLPWVAEQTGYNAEYVKPIILFYDPESINALRYGPEYKNGQVKGMKVIDIKAVTMGNRMILPTDFTLGKDDETLVHELVHILQNENGREIGDGPNDFKCLNLMEFEAYEVQHVFIDEFGIGEKLHPILFMHLSHCPNRYGLP